MYQPGDQPYQNNLVDEMDDEKVRWELAFVRMEAAGGSGLGAGSYRLSDIYPNTYLAAEGYVPVQNYTECTDARVDVPIAPWSGRESFTAVSFKGALWLFGGYDPFVGVSLDDTWMSLDGVNWTLVGAGPWQHRSHYVCGIVNDGTDDKVLIAGGRDLGHALPDPTDVWLMSWDGNPMNPPTWAQVSLTEGTNLIESGTVVFNNALWTFGGRNNQRLVKRTDFGATVGATWTTLPTLPFDFLQPITWTDGTQIYAGMGQVSPLAVRTTVDGIEWDTRIPVLPYLLFARRATALVYNDHIIIAGGYSAGSEGDGWLSLLPPLYDRGDYGRSRQSWWYPFADGSAVEFNGRIYLLGNALINGFSNVGQDVVSFVPLLAPVVTPEGFYLYEKP